VLVLELTTGIIHPYQNLSKDSLRNEHWATGIFRRVMYADLKS